MLVFAGSRCYKSQVTEAGPHPPEPKREPSLRIRGRRNASEEEIKSQEVDSEAVYRQEVDGQAFHRQEGDRQAPRGKEKHGSEGHSEGSPEGCAQAGGGPQGRPAERAQARCQPV